MNASGITPFDSEAGFRLAIDAVIVAAQREVRVFDYDLRLMGLEQKATITALGAFLAAATGNHLRMVVQDLDYLDRYCPRLQALHQGYAHALEIRQAPDEMRHLAEAYVLADRRHGVLRHHKDHPRGKLIMESPEDIHPWWQRFDELWTLSTPWSPARPGL